MKKIVIVGGGVAGLTAAIYARLNGFETELIEMHSATGGQCTAWYRKSYRFDYCLHWLVGTRSGPFNEIWKETHVLTDQVQIIDHDISSKIKTDDGREFIFYTNIDKWQDYLFNMAPGDIKGIKKMCDDLRKSACLKPFADPPGLRNPLKTISSGLAMLPILKIFLKFGKKDCKSYFRSLKFKNPDLVYFLDSLYGARDFSALGFIMMFAWFNQKNTGYLLGGSKPLTDRMTNRFLSLGGKLKTGKKVVKISVSENVANGIVLSDGSEIKADYVISAADGHSTIFGMLEGRYIDKKITDAYEKWELFTPMVQVSFGINKEIVSNAPSELWLNNSQHIGKTKTTHGYSFMNYGFDSTMAPKGKTVLILRFDSPWEIWENMSADQYRAEKEQIEKDSRSLLLKHYPGIAQYIEVVDVATPLTDVNFTGVWKGAYEGFMPSSKTMMKYINPVIPGLKNFYMAGQWLSPGGGIPPSAQSGKWAIQHICKKENIRFNTGKDH